jgi:hypothetical protein
MTEILLKVALNTRALLVTEKLLKDMFKSSLKNFYIRHHELIGRTKYSFLKCQWIFFLLCRLFLSSITVGIL